MKKFLALLLCGAFLLAMSGCRRRIRPDAEGVLQETYREDMENPSLAGGETVPAGEPEGEPEPVFDATAPGSEEETAAEGGERVENGPKPPEPGEEITVTFHPQGGECAVETRRVRRGAVYGTLPLPQYPGHEFRGWFTAPQGGAQVDAATVVTMGEDHTLYAQWSDFLGYTVTFDPNGGRLSAYRREKQVNPGERYGELPTPYLDGYLFQGWFTQRESGVRITAETPFTENGAQTLYAHWEYSPMEYWGYVLKNTTRKIFTCKEVWIYLELEADGVTQPHSPLISHTGSRNVAENREDSHVTDDWVAEKNPGVIVKIASDTGSREAVRAEVENRFPGKQVYVFPPAAVDGTEAEKLYYALTLAKGLYPEYFYEVDLDAVAKELGVDDPVEH